jgi:hypothetical protein
MNRTCIICLGIVLCLANLGKADTGQCPLPILGTRVEGLIYIPRIGAIERTIPRKIMVMGVPFWDEADAPVPKAYVAEFLKEKKAAARKEGDPTTEGEPYSALIYKLVDSPADFHYDDAVIFNVGQNIQYERKDGEAFFKEIGTNHSWFIRRRPSREGAHKLLQSFEGEKCISTVDYYEYAEYGTGEGEDVQKLEKTFCGKRLLPEDVHPEWE